MIEPKILNLSEMFELHAILKPYIQDTPDDAVEFLDFVMSKIKPREYFDCLCLLMGDAKEKLFEGKIDDTNFIFINGLFINRIFYFDETINKLGLV